ncbi:hypothetical protein AMJ57_02540 [Parcubacteria bacterium SG8_24]|nr:MAG: hypothetical protein AMJ57_02540 [Parcubacteria bacterium SG8_24]
MKATTEFIPICQIRVSEKQKRRVSRDKVERHRRRLEDGAELMAIEVNRLADGTYVIAGNGRHRYFAYLELGFTMIPVTPKTKELKLLLDRFFRKLLAPPHSRGGFSLSS